MKITSMEETYARNRDADEDILSAVLRNVRLTSALFYDNQAHAPWVSETPDVREYAHLAMPDAQRVVPFKVITSGSCWAELADNSVPPVRLNAGDVLVISRGQAHVLASSPGMREAEDTFDAEEYRKPADGRILLATINGAKGAETCRFVCGFFGCDVGPFNPLLDALPPLLATQTITSAKAIEAAVADTAGQTAGGASVRARLGELLFVEVARSYVPPHSRGWLAGLRDDHIGAALRLIHSRPTEDWTVDNLARHVGMSRSVFADRFAKLIGLSPMNYLGRWRMQLAARTLEDSDVSVAQAAATVGYESEAAFRRSFKRLVGVSPAEWRRGHAGHHRGTGA
ncbi:AraC family transcriptional regulator [soil metagenome]